MAMLDIDYADVGNDIEIKIRDRLHKARIVEKPIYKFHRKV
jgi:glycine cleavage system aminomethyltransferase T